MNQCITKTCFDVTLPEAELKVGEDAVRRVIRLSKLLLIENRLTLSQFKYIAMLKIFGLDWDEVHGVIGISGNLVGLLRGEITMNKPDVGTSSHPGFKFRTEVLKSILL